MSAELTLAIAVWLVVATNVIVEVLTTGWLGERRRVNHVDRRRHTSLCLANDHQRQLSKERTRYKKQLGWSKCRLYLSGCQISESLEGRREGFEF